MAVPNKAYLIEVRQPDRSFKSYMVEAPSYHEACQVLAKHPEVGETAEFHSCGNYERTEINKIAQRM